MSKKIPLIALIGLPNSGKSTILNKFYGGRKAITAKEEHTTRDLNFADVNYNNFYFQLVDTGGLVPKTQDKIIKEIQIKTWSAIARSDILVWVIDTAQRPETIHQELISQIKRTKKPYIICINKVDDLKLKKPETDYAFLGGLSVFYISARTGQGMEEMADFLVSEISKLGFKAETKIPKIINTEKLFPVKKGKFNKTVNQLEDGTYEIIRENTDFGPGLFSAVNLLEDETEIRKIDNLIFDIWDTLLVRNKLGYFIDLLENSGYQNLPSDTEESVCLDLIKLEKTASSINEYVQKLQNHLKNLTADLDTQNLEFINSLDEKKIIQIFYKYVSEISPNIQLILQYFGLDKKIYYLSNANLFIAEILSHHWLFKSIFSGGLFSSQVGFAKPSNEIFETLIMRYNLDPENSFFVDDKAENVTAAINFDMGGAVFYEKTNLANKLYSWIYDKETDYFEDPGKPVNVLFLGKPNVGKSTLVNSLAGSDLQIVSDIAGTTVSVNDYDIIVPRKKGYFFKQIVIDITDYIKAGYTDFSFLWYLTEKFNLPINIIWPKNILEDQENQELVESLEKYNLKIINPDEIQDIQEINQVTNKTLLLCFDEVLSSDLAKNLQLEETNIVQKIDLFTNLFEEIRRLTLHTENKNYTILDSAGLRRPGKRTSGAEDFASFQTVETAYRADILCLIFDASEKLSHQDQVVAGIAKEAKKGLVVIFNKSDLLTQKEKAEYQQYFLHKFKFLKVNEFIWLSALNDTDFLPVYKAIDRAIDNFQKEIDPNQVRKLFNYLMKQKPPVKMHTQKKAIIYDLVYVKNSPPTFNLLLKNKDTVHWSYIRFIENMLIKQFDLRQTGVVLKIVEVAKNRVVK